MNIVRVNDKITEYSAIFSNVHFFEPLGISSTEVYTIFTIKYFNFIYVSDDLTEMGSIISNLSDIYNNEYNTKVGLLLMHYNPI